MASGGLGMLKHVLCPAGDACTAFRCLFKHNRDRDDTAEGAGETDRKSPEEDELAASKSSNGPRKRLRLSDDPDRASVESPTVITRPVNSVTAKNHTPSEIKQHASQSEELPSLKKSISPPPRRKTAPAPPGTLQGAKQTAESAKTPAVNEASSSPKASTAPKAAGRKSTTTGKAETLNPRFVGNAPGTHEFRWRIVKALHEQYARLNAELRRTATKDEKGLTLTDQELITKTLDEEESCAVKNKTMYGNNIKNQILRYKRMTVAKWKEERLESIQLSNGDAGIKPQDSKAIDTRLSPKQEVGFVKVLKKPLDGLEKYGYVTGIPRDEDVEKARQAVQASGNVEVCDRCTSRFTVYPGRREEDGALTSGGKCLHHPGRPYYLPRDKTDHSKPLRKWKCCYQVVGDSDGCVTADSHVFKTTDPSRLASIWNFAQTPHNTDVPVDRAVCFDCEMGYTVYGMELIRLTAVSWPSGEELLDVLVYPVGEPLDLNTRYSGVSKEDLVAAERWKPGGDHRPVVIPASDPSEPPERRLKLVPSPKAARDLLFGLLSPETALIAHAAENDLNAVRVIHPFVIDTVLLFPHDRGLPMRKSLKHLMETLLDRKIQVDTSGDPDNVQGHDSAEDARAAGDLVRYKIKEEWQKMERQGWKIDADGLLTSPDSSPHT